MPHSEIIVRFQTKEDSDAFFALIGQSRPEKLKSIWFPKPMRQAHSVRQEYVDNES